MPGFRKIWRYANVKLLTFRNQRQYNNKKVRNCMYSTERIQRKINYLGNVKTKLRTICTLNNMDNIHSL